MMNLGAWLFRRRCIQHADPLFDRDEQGRAIFRCPDCLHAWPILPGYEPRPPKPATRAVQQHERRVERRVAPIATPRVAAKVRPRRLGPLPVM
jgi:hypothetical protein